MLPTRVRLQRAAWIALLAMLMAALAPAISQLLQRGSSTAWVEICRAGGGTAWVAVGDLQSKQTPTKGQPHLLDHCPYCSLQAHALPAVPALPTVAAAPLPGFREPTAFLHAPHTAHAWRPAQSRAPPSRA
ncbi:MAG: DUF2946 domain-containing protein [Aquabacterium commune]|uniref:DUF2946 domain-containing protein n=1 Tax=Aquabacterium commune TaxID=70586 RepID=UPI003BB174F8